MQVMTHLQTLGAEAGSTGPAVIWLEVLEEMVGFTARASAAPARAEVVVLLDLVEDFALVELGLDSYAVMTLFRRLLCEVVHSLDAACEPASPSTISSTLPTWTSPESDPSEPHSNTFEAPVAPSAGIRSPLSELFTA